AGGPDHHQRGDQAGRWIIDDAGHQRRTWRRHPADVSMRAPMPHIWPAPGLDDTRDRRVPAFGIVEALDVVEYISSRLGSGPVRFAPHAFGLQRRDEAPHHRIVQTLPERLIEQTTP